MGAIIGVAAVIVPGILYAAYSPNRRTIGFAGMVVVAAGLAGLIGSAII